MMNKLIKINHTKPPEVEFGHSSYGAMYGLVIDKLFQKIIC